MPPGARTERLRVERAVAEQRTLRETRQVEHCCQTMSAQVEHRCVDHSDPYACPDKLVGYTARFDEYGLLVHDGEAGYAGSQIEIRFCPWCGATLPPSQRDAWFERLEALGVDPEDDETPVAFLDSSWYRADSGLWNAVRDLINEPLEPPSVETRLAIDDALDIVLRTYWNASTDGVASAIVEREDQHVRLSGGVHLVEAPAGWSGYSMRPLAAELSLTRGATIRVGAASEAKREPDPWVFADPARVAAWEPELRVPPPID